MRFIVDHLVQKTQRIIWFLANKYSLKIERPGYAHGQNKLYFGGGKYQIEHQIPRSCYFNTRSGSITIGENTMFSEDVKLLTGKHLNIKESEEQNLPLHFLPENGRDIVIGSGCYVGAGAIIIGPVTIGNYVVIAAGSVVTKSCPDRVLIAGCPAKIIRNL